MFVSLSRPTASKFARIFGCIAASLTLLSLSAPSALAAEGGACEGQGFSQPFAALGDLNLYTLVPGGEFNGASEGWELSGGAQIIQTTLPSGSAGNALALPAGSQAVSPPVCVTLLYPTARVWVHGGAGSEAVSVAVAFAGTKTATHPKQVAQLYGQESSWALPSAFKVRPRLGGHEEGAREVRFVFQAGDAGGQAELYGLYVDPRMV